MPGLRAGSAGASYGAGRPRTVGGITQGQQPARSNGRATASPGYCSARGRVPEALRHRDGYGDGARRISATGKGARGSPLPGQCPEASRYRDSARKRRSRRLLVTTNTEENAIAAPGDHRVEQPGRGQRQRRHVVGERPEQVALDGAEGARDSRIASAATRRSPRTRVRSPASIATSVPVPMARPRSAWASAAASLTPSPTMATVRPSACSRSTTADLVLGQHLGDHLVDADLGGDRPATACVVAGQQHRGQPERRAAGAPPRRWSA